MRNKAILGLIVCLFGGCMEPNELYQKTIGASGSRSIQVIEIDSCQYVFLRRYAHVTLIHKGNCKYCKNRLKLASATR